MKKADSGINICPVSGNICDTVDCVGNGCNQDQPISKAKELKASAGVSESNGLAQPATLNSPFNEFEQVRPFATN